MTVVILKSSIQTTLPHSPLLPLAFSHIRLEGKRQREEKVEKHKLEREKSKFFDDTQNTKPITKMIKLDVGTL